MLDIEDFVPLAFFKKEIYTGSGDGMRYCVEKRDDQLIAYTYPEPFCFKATPEEEKQSECFPFTEEGRRQTVDWLNRQYEERREFWDSKDIFKH